MTGAEIALSVVQRWAAQHGQTVTPLTASERDLLDVLAELGGAATVRQIIEHTGQGKVNSWHARMGGALRAGSVERRAKWAPGRVTTYVLTPVGEMLRVSA